MAKGTKNLIGALFFVVICFLSCTFEDVVAGRPPIVEMPPISPGEIVATSSMRWVGPYVLSNRVSIGGVQHDRIIWYSEEGNIIKEINGTQIDANSGNITEYKKDTTIIHSIHDTSRIVLSSTTRYPGSSIHGQEYGMYFFQQYSTENGTFTDFYVNGAFRGRHGPHCKMGAEDFNVSSTGGLAYTRFDPDSTCPRSIVSVDTSGSEVFAFVPDTILQDITPSPSGKYVITSSHYLDDSTGRRLTRLKCYSSTDKVVQVDRPMRFISWVQNTSRMITYSVTTSSELISKGVEIGKKVA